MGGGLTKTRWYRGADVPMREIRKFARQVAERFHPDKIILFGSHAYGTPHADSDVDILVVMPARNELDQAVQIRLTVDNRFPLDLLLRTPENMARRVAQGDTFLQEILAKGKVLHEAQHTRMGAESRRKSSRRQRARKSRTPYA